MVEGHIEARNLFNVELNAVPLRADSASLSVGLGKLHSDTTVESWNLALSDSGSTRFSASKLQVISHEFFSIQPMPIKESDVAFVFDYELQLVKEHLPCAVLETPFRVVFDVSVSIEGVDENIALTFQCPIVIEELFKLTLPQKETLAVTFETNTSEVACHSEFLLLVEIVNRTKESLKLSVFFPPAPALDVLMREEDVRGHVPGDALLQYYHRQIAAHPALFPLRDRFDDVTLEENSCVKLCFPLVAAKDGVHWIPAVRVYDQKNVLEFREYLSINVKN